MDSALALRVSLYEKHTWEDFKGYIISVLQANILDFSSLKVCSMSNYHGMV